MNPRLGLTLLTIATTAALTACNGGAGPAPAATIAIEGPNILPDTSPADPQNPAPPSAPSTHAVDALLFNGSGVSTSDWQTTEQILKSQGLSYQLANSAQLNAMTLEQLTQFGVIVVPGGSGGSITSGLTTATRLKVRQAVRDHGVGYVGFCAGAWVAVGPEAETNNTASYGMAVAKGSVLPSYWPGGNTSLVADMVPVTFADGSVRQLVWWGGPSTPEWSGGVIARYENGKPAISQTWSGKGYVVIAGPHPEAPQSWRNTAGTDSDGLDHDLAVDMIEAAIKKQPLAAY